MSRYINLLPPESFARARARRRRGLLIAGFAVYLLALAALGVFWRGRIPAAQMAVDEQRALNSTLSIEAAALQPSQDLRGQYDEQVNRMQALLASDVSWARLLNDLGRLIPNRIWLDSFQGQAATSEATAGLGQISVTAVAFEYPDVSAWLRTIDSDQFPAMGAAWVNTATSGSIGEADVVNFASLAVLTNEARSDRTRDRIPEVSE